MKYRVKFQALHKRNKTMMVEVYTLTPPFFLIENEMLECDEVDIRKNPGAWVDFSAFDELIEYLYRIDAGWLGRQLMRERL